MAGEQDTIRFDDGAGYEEMMGAWSRLVGEVFLDWVAPPAGLRWVDVGCGNGAFTQLIVDRCSPASVEGVDPSPAQLDFARQRPAGRVAVFREGDAMALPFPDASFDSAAMALVLFFVPEPARGLAEMIRVTRPGGRVSAYCWDMLGGGFPLAALGRVLREMDMPAALPPSVEVSRLDAMQALWQDAGLREVEAREVTVEREFESFDHLWTSSQKGSSVAARLRALPPQRLAEVRERLRAAFTPDAAGRIRCSGRANCVKGRLPA